VNPPSTKSRGVLLGCVVSLSVALIAWVALDLYGHRQENLRDFNPREVARLDTAMWRSYYAKQRVALFFHLTELLRKEYHIPWLRSQGVAYQAAKAAFVFKEGRARNDYEQALPYLRRFYSAISSVSDAPFDAERAARLELEWWIVHRERARHAPGDLPRLLAETAAVMYHVPHEMLLEHGKLRAEAMRIRDARAQAGEVSEQDWSQIANLLDKSWHSLWQAVNANNRVHQLP